MDDVSFAGLPPDPLADVVGDEVWRAGYLASLSEVADEHDRFDDEPDAAGEGADAAGAAGWGAEAGLGGLEHGLPWTVMRGVEHHLALERLEESYRAVRAATARQYHAIAEIVRDAGKVPEPWVGPDPTPDPLWADRRHRSVSAVRAERRDFAVRAAVADIAIRLRVSESTIRARAAHADTLLQRCPALWAAFAAGAVDERNALTAAELAASLPHDAPPAWEAFDTEVAKVAGVLTPATFRIAARGPRTRAPGVARRARSTRGTQTRSMARSGTRGDGDAVCKPARRRRARGDGAARRDRPRPACRRRRAAEGEPRTLAQLRANAFTDLLTTGTTETTTAGEATGRGRPAVAVTVPVLTLLGESEEPATLEGYGPIDTDTARRLAGKARSWVRVLTHPVTGTVLEVDRTTYRVAKDLRRWAEIHHPTCTKPGCRRPARECEMDHLIEWQYGGTTSSTNLGPACTPDHRLRHQSRWGVHLDPDTGEIFWTSPTGRITPADPAPF